jgi:hypothetical protein
MLCCLRLRDKLASLGQAWPLDVLLEQDTHGGGADGGNPIEETHSLRVFAGKSCLNFTVRRAWAHELLAAST